MASRYHTDSHYHYICAARPGVVVGDDGCNFDDYSELAPMAHENVLSQVEQASFLGF